MKTMYILKGADGSYCGSPITTKAPNRNMAAAFTNLAEAKSSAKLVGATVENFATREIVS